MEISEQHSMPGEAVETGVSEQLDKIEEAKKSGEDRIIMLSDGIFAIAVTLLVLDIQIPLDIHASTSQAHAAFIHVLTGDFLSETISYIITFVVLASYWLNHRRLMSLIKRVDSAFLWLNLLFLAFVAFFPIAARVSKYSQFPEAVIVYTVVLAGCGYSAVWLWAYAIGKNQLVDASTNSKISKSRIVSAAITPTFFLLSLLLLFIPDFPPNYVFYSWLLLFLAHPLRDVVSFASGKRRERKPARS